MDSKDITTAQAQAISKSLFRLANYLYRLKSRMEQVGFKSNDPLFVKVEAVHDAVFDLSIDLHYHECSGEVARSHKKAERVFIAYGALQQTGFARVCVAVPLSCRK